MFLMFFDIIFRDVIVSCLRNLLIFKRKAKTFFCCLVSFKVVFHPPHI